MATMRLGSRSVAGAPVSSGCLRSFTGFVAAPPAQSAAGTIRASFSAPAAGGERGRLVVRMARVGGVEIPNQKRLETALTCAPRISRRSLVHRAWPQVHLWNRSHDGEGHLG